MYTNSEWLPAPPKGLGSDEVFASPVFCVDPPPFLEIDGVDRLFEGLVNPKAQSTELLQTLTAENMTKIHSLNAILPVLQHLEKRAHCDQECRYTALDTVDGDEASLPEDAERKMITQVALSLFINFFLLLTFR